MCKIKLLLFQFWITNHQHFLFLLAIVRIIYIYCIKIEIVELLNIQNIKYKNTA